MGIDNSMDENKRDKILSILSKERQFKEIDFIGTDAPDLPDKMGRSAS